MSVFLGMDTEQVDAHAELLTSRARRLETLGGELTGAVAAVIWVGSDADAFRDQATSVMQQFAEWTRRCDASAADLVDHVAQQDRASGADGGAGGLIAGGVASMLSGGAISGAIAFGGTPTTAGGPLLSRVGPRLGAALGSHDDPGDDIAPITADDISRPDDSTDPSTIAEMMDNLHVAGEAQKENSTTIRVQQVLGDDGQTRYIVYVPGSHGEKKNIIGPDATGNPMDWNQNPGALGGQETDSSQAVIAAMESAGIPHGADVSLVSHSQGGIVANNLAADPSVNGAADGWNVDNVVSVGSPVELADVPSSTRTVNFAHEPVLDEPLSPVLADVGAPLRGDHPVGDVVPTLDGDPHHPAGTPSHRDEIGLPAPTSSPGENHSVPNYRDSINDATGQTGNIIESIETGPSMRQYLEEGEVVDTVDVSVSREDGTYEDQKTIPEIITDSGQLGRPHTLPGPGIG
ncbi:MAG: WXG100 family type VII secretion target [Brachybacterium sp.]|uniref:hypothetical protein n=1 Tax=Brachybacterium sp. TaxID=1891286 RepID=UPI00264A2DD7|nr:hypothetical protein [Brachybacterium sp.]MDN5686922.1 WXG100 family type VII secretion target [Brachybacterium sp.]